jgi:hypothetical protein
LKGENMMKTKIVLELSEDDLESIIDWHRIAIAYYEERCIVDYADLQLFKKLIKLKEKYN